MNNFNRPSQVARNLRWKTLLCHILVENCGISYRKDRAKFIGRPIEMWSQALLLASGETKAMRYKPRAENPLIDTLTPSACAAISDRAYGK